MVTTCSNICVLFIAAILVTAGDVSGYENANLVEGDVRLVGGETGTAGRAEIFHEGEWLSICFSAGPEHEWELPEGDAFCKQLGFTRGAALVLDGADTAMKFGNGNGDTFLTNVDCVDGADHRGLLSCSNVQWGSSCDNSLGVVGVVCRLPGFVGCYRYDHPGFLVDHEITANAMTLDKCLEACQRHAPEQIRYAGVRQFDCNCGVELPAHREEDHQCYEECPGDDFQTCGAYLRTAIYELGDIRDGHVAPHILWPSWDRYYNSGDDGRVWRVDIVGYNYAVLHLLSWDLAEGDSILLRSESRQLGTTFYGNLNFAIPYRWVSNRATWFEVQTQVQSNTPGGRGFIIYYEFGLHCDASDLPDIDGGRMILRNGVYFDRDCPSPICDDSYEPFSNAVCLLNGTWTGTASCTKIPTTRRSLFPINGETQPPILTTPTPPPTFGTTVVPETERPNTSFTQPPPPDTQPPLSPVTRAPTPATRAPPPPPMTLPPVPRPPAQCVLPNINKHSVLLGTGGNIVFYERSSINHCCTYDQYDCMTLSCQSNGRWTNEYSLDRCETAVCPVPVTNDHGSIGGVNGRSYFKGGDEVSLCCIYSDYCYALKCLTDGTWENGDQLFRCPMQRPHEEDLSTVPTWIIAVIIVAAICGLLILVICVCVCCFLPQRPYGHSYKRRLTYLPRLRKSYQSDPSPYVIGQGYGYPPASHPVQVLTSQARPIVSQTAEDYRKYAKYGAKPVITSDPIYKYAQSQTVQPDSRRPNSRERTEENNDILEELSNDDRA